MVSCRGINLIRPAPESVMCCGINDTPLPTGYHRQERLEAGHDCDMLGLEAVCGKDAANQVGMGLRMLAGETELVFTRHLNQ